MTQELILLYWLILFVCGGLIAATMLYFGYQVLFRSTTLHGPVFAPSADDRLEAMLRIATVKHKARLLDMGSGDGKVVIALAQQFPWSHVDGVELNPFLIHRSKMAVMKAWLTSRVTILHQSFWKINLGDYDVVYLYGTSYIMKKLEKKVIAEMRPGTQFVSNYFQFPNLKPTKTDGVVRLYEF